MREYDHPMINNFTGRTRFFSSLIAMGIIVLYWFVPAAAGQLVDIRVGEYDGFTRIVFELDAPTTAPQIEPQTSGKLLVSFDGTQAQLVRKIPVERSRHVHEIQIWQRDGKLSSIVVFDYPNIRIKTFTLTNPPRIGVDVFPMLPSKSQVDSPPPAAEAPAETAQEALEKDAKIATGESSMETKVQPLTEKDVTDQVENGSPKTEQNKEVIDQEVDIGESKSPVIPEPSVPELPKLRKSVPEQSPSPPPANGSKNTPVRLQFFLVIGLVVITIGILFLLLLMLFARHKLSDNQKKLRTGDFIEEQDQRIEALDSRIKEQLKRYDEA